jgi:poly-gamma-glutamate capsule biosynthesis protein CapA/YwtB (metallophosphatase superfamily)
MNRYIFFFILFLSAGLSLVCTENSSGKTDEFIQDDSTTTITIAAVGDLMCHSTQYIYAHKGGDDYDFNPFFRDISEYLSSAHFTFGNFETVTGGKSKGYSGYPFFNTPDQYLDALKNSGFDLVTTSNNHSLDQGEKGLLRTIEQIDSRGMNYNGTFSSQKDRDSIRIFNIEGIKLAFLAYTYGTNDIPVPKNKSFLVNLINPELIRQDIKNARETGADIIIVHYHFGEEYKQEPSGYQKEVVEMTISAGADIIIGGHPHVLQPVEIFKTNGGTVDTGFTAYSLGNFFSNQRWRYSDAGVILYFQIEKDLRNGKYRIAGIEYLPTWVYRGNREYRILPAEGSYDFLNYSDQQKMQQSFEDTKNIMTKYSDKITLKSVK